MNFGDLDQDDIERERRIERASATVREASRLLWAVRTPRLPDLVIDTLLSTVNYEKKIRVTTAPRYSAYTLYIDRLATFSVSSWHLLDKTQTPERLAYVGFFFSGYADQTLCFHCGMGIQSWENDDQPAAMHAMWSPRCEFMSRLNDLAFDSDENAN